LTSPAKQIRQSDEIAARFLHELEALTRDVPGVTRDSYGTGENAAHGLLARYARDLGLPSTIDAAGNMYVTLEGQKPDAPAWIIGSHLDSVPHGGNFDGAAGVAAGLAVLARLRQRSGRPLHSVIVIAIRAEESTWFPASYIGSRAAFGLLKADELQLLRADTGLSLADHLRDTGLSAKTLLQSPPHLRPGAIRGFVEVHIEQGPTLVLDKRPIGLVSAIAGSFRYRSARVIGAYGHSGAVSRRHRHDAVFAFSDLVRALDVFWAQLDAAGDDATITFGQVSTDPALQAFSKIPGELRFSLDVRSGDASVLERIRERLRLAVQEIERSRGVSFDLGPLTGSKPAVLSCELQDRLACFANSRGVPFLKLPSGAGHDAAVFAQQGVPTAMIFVRNDNGSHNPDEEMELEDLDPAIEILSDLVSE
jgi:N-carbamoyl-L-amino-acid hydrolase